MQTLDSQKMEKLERSASLKRTFYRWLLFITLGIFALYYLAPLYVPATFILDLSSGIH